MMSNVRPRDVDALIVKYKRLLSAVYNEQKGRFDHKSDKNSPKGESPKGNLNYTKDQLALIKPKSSQDELMSYILYQFILLVKEYDPQSGVDFPGYIKTKLYLRTRHSYIKKLFAHKGKEELEDMNQDDYAGPGHVDNVAYQRIQYITGANDLTSDLATTGLEHAIMASWMEGNTGRKESFDYAKGITKCNQVEFDNAYTKLEGRLYERAKELNLINKD